MGERRREVDAGRIDASFRDSDDEQREDEGGRSSLPLPLLLKPSHLIADLPRSDTFNVNVTRHRVSRMYTRWTVIESYGEIAKGKMINGVTRGVIGSEVRLIEGKR